MTLDIVQLDTTGWKVFEWGPYDRSWWVDGDPVRFRLLDQPSPEITIEGWRNRAASETAAGSGTCISFEDQEIGGHSGFRGIFKYPATRCIPGFPADSLAVYIVGLLVVPLDARHLLINTEALERGTTGTREAVYGVLHPPGKVPTTPVNRAGWEGYADSFRRSLGAVRPSDGPELDAALPQHPLSRVRDRQRQIVAGLRLNVDWAP